MLEDDRIWHARDLVKEHVSSPSLRHIRDPAAILSISRRILKKIDRGTGIWQKWEGEREVLIKSAVGCWIPTDSLRDYLNLFSGPKLTSTDVAQRMKAIEGEPYTSYQTTTYVRDAWRSSMKKRSLEQSCRHYRLYRRFRFGGGGAFTR
ncbi:hypothetical protein AB3480_18375 [Rhizobium mongolense]